MTTPYSSEAEREERLHEVLLTYVEAAEAGRAPDRFQFLADYAEFAAELAEFFASRDQLERLASPLREVAHDAPARTALLDRRPEPSGRRSHGSGEPDGAASPPAVGQLGDFRLLREIGRGGMGIVYQAEQISLGRPVALKILPFAAALDPKYLQRFKNEAQAAAHLHHTNIVPVHAVGCERGVHYYAMQLIEGQSLAAMIAELRQLAQLKAAGQATDDSSLANDLVPGGLGVPNLTTTGEQTGPYLPSSSPNAAVPAPETATQAAAALPTERSVKSRRFFRRVAHLGMKAAEALEHAHQLGVVHRDIKPANLLVDVRGNLWITDFGLALFQSDMGLTLTGELLGTLRYMSPEQALGQRALVDHRTDIYSLGVTLYELLTLRPAFDGNDRQELLHQITQDDPLPPRLVDKGIPVELETIVLKAIAKNPAERYATAQDLADDLQRFLDDQPVLARRPTVLDKVRKWQRRHKAAVWAAGVSAALLVCGTALGSVFMYLRIAEEQAKTQKAYDGERAKAQEAEANFQQAREAVDSFFRVIEDLGDKPELKDARRRLLAVAKEYYTKFIDQHQENPSIRDELVATLTCLAKVLEEMDAPVDALAAGEQARRLIEEGMRGHPNDPYSRQRLDTIDRQLCSIQGCRELPLLRLPKVQDELQLSDAQRQAVARLQDESSRQRWELFKGPPGLNGWEREDRRQRLNELAAKNRQAIAELLQPDQANRLTQINRQWKVPSTFHDPEAAEALALSPEQIDLITIIVGQFETFRREHGHHGFKGDHAHKAADHRHSEEDRKQIEALRKDATRQIMKALTFNQKAKWEQWVGKPFEVDWRSGFGDVSPRIRRDRPGDGPTDRRPPPPR